MLLRAKLETIWWTYLLYYVTLPSSPPTSTGFSLIDEDTKQLIPIFNFMEERSINNLWHIPIYSSSTLVIVLVYKNTKHICNYIFYDETFVSFLIQFSSHPNSIIVLRASHCLIMWNEFLVIAYKYCLQHVLTGKNIDTFDFVFQIWHLFIFTQMTLQNENAVQVMYNFDSMGE